MVLAASSQTLLHLPDPDAGWTERGHSVQAGTLQPGQSSTLLLLSYSDHAVSLFDKRFQVSGVSLLKERKKERKGRLAT